jgi:hypothetical protein
MREHIGEAQQSPEHLCDDRHCCRVADALIAVDGIKLEVFAANNPAEWELLARILDKQLINPAIKGTEHVDPSNRR